MLLRSPEGLLPPCLDLQRSHELDDGLLTLLLFQDFVVVFVAVAHRAIIRAGTDKPCQ